MSIERSWRFDATAETATHMDEHQEEMRHLREHGVLIPDNRLQAIAEAWGSSDIRAVEAQSDVRGCWPGLAVLLDALTKEER